MAHIYPGATWRPQTGQERRARRRKGRGVGFHIAVYEGPSIWSINERTGNDAHLYVRRDGSVEQNIDLDLVAYAGAAGNATMIWVETQGGTTAADVKTGRWDPPQAETLAQIAAWAHRTEDAPLQLMPDSKPTSRGLATHRLGIKHSRGIGAVPGWLVPGGELWSSAVGKECPGDARVAQLGSDILPRSIQIVNGDDDMPLTGDDYEFWMYGPRFRGNENYAQVIHAIAADAAAARQESAAQRATLATLANAIAAGANNVDADDLKATLAASTETAVRTVLEEQLKPFLRTALTEAQKLDNEDQVDQLFAELVERLTPAAG